MYAPSRGARGLPNPHVLAGTRRVPFPGAAVPTARGHVSPWSPSWPQEQKGKVPQHGCSHGFHRLLPRDSCGGTGLRVSSCSRTAWLTLAITAWYRGSEPGDRGRASEGSLERSKSKGGLCTVTRSPKQEPILQGWNCNVMKWTFQSLPPECRQGGGQGSRTLVGPKCLTQEPTPEKAHGHPR